MWRLSPLFMLMYCCCLVSGKRGFAVGFKQFMCDDFTAWNNITWWYDWQMNKTYLQKHYNCSHLGPYTNAYVPMVWGRESLENMNISITEETPYILGFNEPNHFEQSNLTGQQAALLWRELETRSRGKPIVSPSASHCGSKTACHGDAEEWFDLFFKYCQGCRVDYLATHLYECDAKNAFKYLEKLYKRYGLQIWLTEFACPYTADPAQELKFMQELLPQLEKANFIFRYDWQMNFWYYHTHTNCTNIDSHKYNHIPMVWGWDPRHTIGVPSNTWAILGFNEPNFHSQSNLTVSQAVTHWAEVERHSHGRPLVSPAAAPCHTTSKCYGDSFEWFDEFFRQCVGCRIDYLATHAYHCTADTTMAYLQKLYSRYGKKIWLTEFACPNSHDRQKQLHYMQDLLPRLEAADFVYRYSWYKARIVESGHITTAASLLHSHTSGLTSLGDFYVNFEPHGQPLVG